MPTLSPRARWAVPAGVLAAVAAVMAGALVSTAQASPSLPARTPAQLLAAVAGRAGPPPPLSGTVVETAALGLPDLPGMSDPTSVVSLLAGSHTARIWYAGPRAIRLSVPGMLSESDLIVHGDTAWYWRSDVNAVTRIALPAGRTGMGSATGPWPVPGVALTPQQAARQAVAAAGPTTRVSVQRNVVVAGQAAYQLVLAPRSSGSLISSVRIAIDAARYLPLRVQVFARGAAAPAFQVGYTAVSFAMPAAASFDFTPPPGAKVTRLAAVRPGHAPAGPPSAGSGAALIGHGWLAVAELPAAALSGLAGGGASAAAGAASSAAHAASGSGPADPAVSSGEDAAMLGALLRSAAPVHGRWGSGRLLRTRLVSVLITSKGKAFAGAVSPSVLFADAAGGR